MKLGQKQELLMRLPRLIDKAHEIDYGRNANRSAKTILLFIFLLLSSCIEPVEVKTPPLPCFDGWQFSLLGEPIVNPDTGAQLTCGVSAENIQ